MWIMVYFVFLGVVGGCVYVLVHSSDWTDLTRFMAFKRVVLGAIVGGLYYLLYSAYSFPNLIMAFVSGYAGTDFIDKIVKRLWREE